MVADRVSTTTIIVPTDDEEHILAIYRDFMLAIHQSHGSDTPASSSN